MAPGARQRGLPPGRRRPLPSDLAVSLSSCAADASLALAKYWALPSERCPTDGRYR